MSQARRKINKEEKRGIVVSCGKERCTREAVELKKKKGYLNLHTSYSQSENEKMDKKTLEKYQKVPADIYYMPSSSDETESNSLEDISSDCEELMHKKKHSIDQQLMLRIKNSNSERLSNISRAPITCPETSCESCVGYSLILSHMVYEHPAVEKMEIFIGEPKLLNIMHKKLIYSQANCAGMLLYGGEDDDHLPGNMGLCMENSFIFREHSKYTNHLPIFIMASKTNLDALFNKMDFLEATTNHREQEEVIVIWFSSPEIIVPLKVAVTVANNSLIHVKSHTMRVRDIRQSQRPENFCATEFDYIWLSYNEFELFAQKPTDVISMEICISEGKQLKSEMYSNNK